MDWKNCIILILIGIALIFVFGIISPASAIDVRQGDYAYLDETVDISLAASWPDFALAYCKGDSYGCSPPDQIIQITGNMHKYKLDSKVWRTGTYYRWDGSWNRGENMVAFTILPGVRPAIVNATTQPINPITDVQIKKVEGPYHFTIARGDTAIFKTYQNRTDPGHLWIFAATKDSYDIPLEMDNQTYSRTLTFNQTFAMDVGKYDGYLQFNGNNKMQDVFIKDGYLDTPYDDAVVPDVDLELWNLVNMRSKFEKLTQETPNFDDVLIPITVQVLDPIIMITNVEQDEDMLWISGSTTWSDGTVITLKLDPDNYKLASDIALHTWQSTAHGDMSTARVFSTAMKIKKEELYIGVHEIQMTTEVNKFVTTMNYNFRISDVYVMPTPTPAIVRRITAMDYTDISKNVTPTPEPLPEVVVRDFERAPYVAPPEPVSYAIATTATIIPNTTKPTATPTKDPNITVPLPFWIGIAAVFVVAWRKGCER
jgi:hypothetical protein